MTLFSMISLPKIVVLYVSSNVFKQDDVFKDISWLFHNEEPIYVLLCTIWYHLHNLKNVKKTHGGVLLLVTKSNTPPWVFFTFFKLYKCYQIAQHITYMIKLLNPNLFCGEGALVSRRSNV